VEAWGWLIKQVRSPALPQCVYLGEEVLELDRGPVPRDAHHGGQEGSGSRGGVRLVNKIASAAPVGLSPSRFVGVSVRYSPRALCSRGLSEYSLDASNLSLARNSTQRVLGALPDFSLKMGPVLQEYLAHKKKNPPRTLP